ncbi:MAG TPA: phospho-N-acetylmuramoyl-pentapeptide-transferase [Bacteroidales bacterium]|nr:phospho-N-acetylmuramoyl-pentapeptide-transferase [Bacteroidales bacterium]HRZ48277.1 phospho-N-acetylmuramoyl-pentapeptide-transferase [Bacteroidales bacterium]
MLYHLFSYLDATFDIPGAGMFNYISFRAALSVITSLVITLLFGKRIINFLKKKQVGETVRDLGLEGQVQKQGTPTMGGIIILSAILIPTLLFANLTNIYIILILAATVWLGLMGFLDDYIKVFRKNKQGLAGRFKVIGQLVLGVAVGVTMLFSESIVIREKIHEPAAQEITDPGMTRVQASRYFHPEAVKSTKTTIPFIKNNEFDYASLIRWIGPDYRRWAWIVFIPIVVFIIIAVSNGTNLTDGLDGLATGTSAVSAATMGILAWVSGNFIFANYLNIMYLPATGELTIFISAFVGACIGFLWYNAYPAQVFMGDTGSLAIGGVIAVLAIMLRKELLIPILCGIFLVENLSVVMQVTWFKFTKKRYGTGRRILKMAPLHHHYQKQGYHESKIVMRFIIVSVMLAVFSVITLKIR